MALLLLIACAAKFRLPGLTRLVLPCPMPLSVMRCGLPGALLVTVIVPLRVPLALGLKVMSRPQKPPEPRPTLQLWLTA